MKSSLFRIDRNSIIAQDSGAAGIVVLPRLEDMMQKLEKESNDLKSIEEEIEAAETEDNGIDAELEMKQRLLEKLQAQVEEEKQKAARYINEAKEEAQRLYEKAVNEGFKAGYAKAQSQVSEERRVEKETLAGALKSLSAAREALYDEMEGGLLDLARCIAEHIIKTELQSNDEAYKNIVRSLIVTLKNQSNIILKVSKTEYEKYFADPTGDLASEISSSGIRVTQDMTLKSGDCFVETEYGYVNAGVRTQLNRLEFALKQIGADN
jgi:flagellar assembly protein FliH